MKIKGKKVSARNFEPVVLPRQNWEDIVFMAGSVLDYAEFDAICPQPTPPTIRRRGEEPGPDFDDKDYLAKVVSKQGAGSGG